LEAHHEKWNSMKMEASPQAHFSFHHPKYPFIKSNRDWYMVKQLLENCIFPDRITLEEELFLWENHSPGWNPIWLTPAVRALLQ
jgi:hypothetical protein